MKYITPKQVEREAPYLSAYVSIINEAKVPVANSTFDIHLDGTQLIYIKEPCLEEDVGAPFFLHVFPSDNADLATNQITRFFLHVFPSNNTDLAADKIKYGFNNLDFTFWKYGAIYDGKCLAIFTLPDYDIALIRTGQFISGEGKLWIASIPILILPFYDSILAGEFGAPVVTAGLSPFDIRLYGTTLTYLDEICDKEDVAARFFLHIVPSDDADLSADRIEYGNNNLDFDFAQHGAVWDGRCLAVVTLPDYDIARIRTGQYIIGEGSRLWEADFKPAKTTAE